MPELIQQQTPDYIGSILRGYQFGQQVRVNQLEMLAKQQEMDINQQKLIQAQAENTLTEMAAMGDQKALQRLAAYNPARAEGVRKQQDYNDVQGARVLDSYASMPQYAFSQKKWEQMHEEYRAATGKELPLPSEKSPEAILEFKRLSSRLKGREQDLKEQYQSAQIKTEGLQQAKYGVDIQKGRQDLQKGTLDIMKSRGELLAAEQERQMAKEQGLTVGAFKEQQQKIGQFRGEQISKIPQAEQNIETTTKLVNELINHPGMSDVVGFKGAARVPFTNLFLSGTDAAGFMAKYNQLKGKQFLESIAQLQGFGALSNLEGTTATNAASAMDISTSEAEFKRNAMEYQRIMKLGLERMKKGVGYDNRPIEVRDNNQSMPNQSSANLIEWGDL